MIPSPFPALIRAVTLIAVAACFMLIALDRAQVFGDNLRATVGLFYGWVILLGGFALILGAANVAWVHLRHVQGGSPGWGHSLALLVVFFAVLTGGLIAPGGAASPLMEWFFTHLIAPGQAALFALLIFFMAAAAYRYLRIGRTGGAWLLGGTLLMLVAQMPASADWLPTPVAEATSWLLEEPVMAALRGVLLGTSLAAILVGFRTLLGRS